jgi:bacteriophage exclusion system BrxA-like protein
MMVADRSNVVSSFTIIKGALIPETYDVLSHWDLNLSKKANLNRLRRENYIGAASETWLRDVVKVLNRRLDPNGRDRALVTLCKGACAIDAWRPIYLWHLTRDEFLVRDFLVNWLFTEYEDGAFRLRPEDLEDYLRTIRKRGGETEHPWTDTTLSRVAGGLLKMAVDFGLLRGGASKEFTGYHVPERSLVYLLHAVFDHEGRSPRRLMDSREWRIYLVRPSDLEAAVLRLHQFRALDYQVAGSLVQLSLPCENALEYAESMVA